MRIVYKNFLLKLILGALFLTEVNAMNINEDDVKRGMTMRPNETATHFDNRVREEQDKLLHQQRMAQHNQDLVDNAGTGLQKLHVTLNNNRWAWYSGFAGLGSGLWLTMAFGGPGALEAGTGWFMLGGAVGGLIVGGSARCAIKNCCNVDVDMYMRDTCFNVIGGLCSFMPWAGFATTIALLGGGEPPAPAPEPHIAPYPF